MSCDEKNPKVRSEKKRKKNQLAKRQKNIALRPNSMELVKKSRRSVLHTRLQ